MSKLSEKVRQLLNEVAEALEAKDERIAQLEAHYAAAQEENQELRKMLDSY